MLTAFSGPSPVIPAGITGLEQPGLVLEVVLLQLVLALSGAFLAITASAWAITPRYLPRYREYPVLSLPAAWWAFQEQDGFSP